MFNFDFRGKLICRTHLPALLLLCNFDHNDCANTTSPPIWRTTLKGQCFSIGNEIAEVDWDKYGLYDFVRIFLNNDF
jgi:hypothetical protein